MDLSKIVFDSSLTHAVQQHITRTSDDDERTELLSLLLGRVLQIQEGEEVGGERDDEVRQIVEITLATDNASQATAEITRSILRFLPARTEAEITLLIELALKTEDKSQQEACATALRQAHPQDSRAWDTLEAAQTSGVSEMEQAARARLEQRR